MLKIVISLHILILGFMIFFMSVVSPTVFKTLNEVSAGKFLRTIFPRMFLYGFILSFLAFLISFIDSNIRYWSISLTSSILFLFNTYVITPRINLYRDQFKAGDLSFETKFKQFHLISVFIFLFQLLGSSFLVILYFL